MLPHSRCDESVSPAGFEPGIASQRLSDCATEAPSKPLDFMVSRSLLKPLLFPLCVCGGCIGVGREGGGLAMI